MDKDLSCITYNDDFIKTLLKKLKVGTAKSIHLNSLPGASFKKMDLCALGNHEDFLKVLLQKDNFSFEVNLNTPAQEADQMADTKRKLTTLEIENNDNYLEFGIKNLGLGFPLLIKRDHRNPKRVIKAPLFIWNLDLGKSPTKANTWIIKRAEDHPIKLNELLLAHLAAETNIQLSPSAPELLPEGVLDKNALITLCNKILTQLNGAAQIEDFTVSACPAREQADARAENQAQIHWGGVFGIYASQKETIINSLEALRADKRESLAGTAATKPLSQTRLTCMEMDPSQTQIINTLTDNEIKLIQGPPGTGKSQCLTGILTNLLANQSNALVVCEKKTALDVIYANLKALGLEQHVVLIDDVNKARRAVIKKAREINDNKKPPAPYPTKELAHAYKEYVALGKKIQAKYQAAAGQILMDYSWKDLIGIHWALGEHDRLNRQGVNYEGVNFNDHDYQMMRERISTGSDLRGKLGAKALRALQCFNEWVFARENNFYETEGIKNHLSKIQSVLEVMEDYLERHAGDLQKRKLSILDRDQLTQAEELITALSQKLTTLKEVHQTGYRVSGGEFYQKPGVGAQVAALFSKKTREIVKLKLRAARLVAEVGKLNQDFLEAAGYEVSTEGDLLRGGNFRANEERLLAAAERGQAAQEVVGVVKKHFTCLRAYESQLQELMQSELLVLTEIKTKDFQHVDDYKNHIHEAGRLVTEITESMPKFRQYHAWKVFKKELASEPKLNAIVKALENYPPAEWEKAFKAWYVKGAIMDYEGRNKKGFMRGDDELRHWAKLHDFLQKHQVGQINHQWNSRKRARLDGITYNFNGLYNLKKNKAYGRKNPLKKIIARDMETLQTMFPIILTNPESANALFPVKKGLFDMVMFDEASQLRLEEVFTCLVRGKHKVVAGDQHQMPPSHHFKAEPKDENNDRPAEVASDLQHLATSESLLDYCADLGDASQSHLDFHYRSKHPALIEFSNHAIYGGNLVHMPLQENYQAINFRQLNGVFNDGVNAAEVEEVKRILIEEIEPQDNGEYPSVGVGTFNVEQRNTIIKELLEQAEKDRAFAAKYQQLKNSGLFIKNLENIQGDERDIMILSTGYGIKEDTRQFEQRFGNINQKDGYKLLNVLVTRAKEKLYVCTSVPKDKYLNYLEHIDNGDGNNRKGLFYAYLAYAEAVSAGDKTRVQQILKSLDKYSHDINRTVPNNQNIAETPFENEVNNHLKDHFDKDKILPQHKIGGFTVDFLIQSGMGKGIIVECDGKSRHQSKEAATQDLYRQKTLESLGYTVRRLWATNWFDNRDTEMKKLLESIHEPSQSIDPEELTDQEKYTLEKELNESNQKGIDDSYR